MATYQTKHLEATREISHGDKFLKPGETFHASEVDAEHFLRTGQAKHAKTEPAPAAKAAAKTAAAKTPTPRAAAPRAAAPAPAPTPAPAPAPAPNPVPTPEGVTVKTWERTEPLMKLEDVPHAEIDTTPPKE